jgi:hypothetical protein
MSSYKVFPYNPASRSAKLLSDWMEVKRLRKEGSKYKGEDYIINWGASSLPDDAHWTNNLILNHPSCVRIASNKLLTFERLNGIVNIPPFTQDIKEAKEWIRKRKVVFCRTELKGSGGSGIVIAEKTDDLVVAPLYTQYIPKREEYRVHINATGQVLIQKKVLPFNTEGGVKQFRIRNRESGFVFTRVFEWAPHINELVSQSRIALQVMDLDFGAVDCIYNGKRGEGYLLEINTAPGLSEEAGTVEFYANGFSSFRANHNESPSLSPTSADFLRLETEGSFFQTIGAGTVRAE